ncbi:MAG: hypothetical protein ACE5Z5_09130 [Candidatus Bathyarchaeia archaeon]
MDDVNELIEVLSTQAKAVNDLTKKVEELLKATYHIIYERPSRERGAPFRDTLTLSEALGYVATGPPRGRRE